MDAGITGDAVDNVVGLHVVEPPAFVDLGIGGFRGREEGEVADDLALVFYHKGPFPLHVCGDDCLRGVAV